MPRIRLLTLLALCLLPLGCTTTHIASSTPGQITVVATTTQMQDLVRHVGGQNVHLVGILKPNVDPHDFEPSPSTAIALTGAKLVVESGVGVDSWVDGLVANAVPGTPVWVASHGLPLRTGDSSEPDGDPHWWHDPTLFERAATALGERLASIDPPHADAYRANARRYVTEIRAMDAANKRLIATVPRGDRKLVTNHDAFGYFAAHYGITVVGSVLPSLSTVAQPSAKDVVDLIGKIRAAARARHLHRVVAEPGARAADRVRGRGQGLREPVRRHAGAAGVARCHVHRDGALEHAGDGGRVPGHSPAPAVTG